MTAPTDEAPERDAERVEVAHKHIEEAVGDLCWIAEQLQGEHIKVSWTPDSEYVEEAIWQCTQEIEDALRRLRAPQERTMSDARRQATMRSELNPAEKEMTTAERLRHWSDDPDLPPVVTREMQRAARLLRPQEGREEQEGSS